MASIDAVTTPGAILGAVLVKLRTEKGMKQADLAAAIGLGASTWSRIEKGDSGLSIDQLRLVSKVLGVTPGLILEMVEAAEKEVEQHGVRIDPSAASWASLGKGTAAGAAIAGILPIGALMGGRATGAALGTVIPILGPALGSLIGGAVAAYLHKSEKDKQNK